MRVTINGVGHEAAVRVHRTPAVIRGSLVRVALTLTDGFTYPWYLGRRTERLELRPRYS